jgi:uncharacterized protein involved in cysteine biosynthesis
MLWSALLYLFLLLVSYWLVVPPLQRLTSGLGLGNAGNVLVLVAYGAAWFFLSGLVFLGIMSLLSSLMWDKLSVEVESLLGPVASRKIPLAAVIADSAKRTIFTLFLAVLGLLGGLCIPLLCPILAAAYVGLLDYTAPAFARRGKLLRDQRRDLKKLKNRYDFALVAGLITLVPLLNVIMLPFLVAAGTVMVARSGVEPA